MEYIEILKRMQYFRKKAKLSAREVSMRLGFNPQYIAAVENNTLELKMKVLIDFCELLNISIYDFFYLGEVYNEDQKQIIDDLFKLKSEEQALIVNMIKSLKDKKK